MHRVSTFLLNLIMNTTQNIFLKLLAGIITSVLIYLIVSTFISNDFFLSIQPGWHTIIYPFGTPLKFTVIILVFTLITYLLFKYVLKALTLIYIRFFKDASKPVAKTRCIASLHSPRVIKSIRISSLNISTAFCA